MKSQVIGSYIYVVCENVFFCIALPIFFQKAKVWIVKKIDTRRMYSITICYYLAFLCGILASFDVLIGGDFFQNYSIQEIWSMAGVFHEPRFIQLVSNLANSYTDGNWPNWAVLSYPLVVKAIFFVSLVNFLIAIAGWRSVGAFRGIVSHFIIASYYFLMSLFCIFLIGWMLHWLNFWFFLVAIVFIEIKRRQRRETRLSF